MAYLKFAKSVSSVLTKHIHKRLTVWDDRYVYQSECGIISQCILKYCAIQHTYYNMYSSVIPQAGKIHNIKTYSITVFF